MRVEPKSNITLVRLEKNSTLSHQTLTHRHLYNSSSLVFFLTFLSVAYVFQSHTAQPSATSPMAARLKKALICTELEYFFITRCSRSRRKRAFTSAWSIAGWVVKHPLYLHRHTLMLPYFNLKRKDWNPLGLKTTICSVGSCVRSSVHMPVARIYICSPFA